MGRATSEATSMMRSTLARTTLVVWFWFLSLVWFSHTTIAAKPKHSLSLQALKLSVNSKLFQKRKSWHYHALLPSFRHLHEMPCLHRPWPKTTRALHKQISRQISFQLYAGVLRGALGTCLARAGNSADQALLLAYLLQQQGERVRIVQAWLSTKAQKRVMMASQTQEQARMKREQQRATRFDRQLQGLARRSQAYKQAARLRLRLRRRPLLLMTRALRQILPLFPIQSAQRYKHQRQRRKQLERESQRHTWVQLQQGKKWIDLDPSLRLPFGKAIRSPRKFYTLGAFTQWQAHKLHFTLEVQLQQGQKQKRMTTLSLRTDAASLVGTPIVLRHKSCSAPLPASKSKPAPSGLQYYCPSLHIGRLQVKGQALPLDASDATVWSKQWRVISETLRITVRSPLHNTRIHQRVLFDRAGLAQQKKSPPWALAPMSSSTMGRLPLLLSSPVILTAISGSPHPSLALQPLVRPEVPALAQQASILYAYQIYTASLHSELQHGLYAGYQATPRLTILRISPELRRRASALRTNITTVLSLDTLRRGWRIIGKGNQLGYGMFVAALEQSFLEWLHPKPIATLTKTNARSFVTKTKHTKATTARGTKPRLSPLLVLPTALNLLQRNQIKQQALRWVYTPRKLRRANLSPDLTLALRPLISQWQFIMPHPAIDHTGRLRYAWLRLDPETGRLEHQNDTLTGTSSLWYQQKRQRAWQHQHVSCHFALCMNTLRYTAIAAIYLSTHRARYRTSATAHKRTLLRTSRLLSSPQSCLNTSARAQLICHVSPVLTKPTTP